VSDQQLKRLGDNQPKGNHRASGSVTYSGSALDTSTMRIIGLATLTFILSSPLAADDNPRCRSVLQTGQSLAEQIDLLQSSYDEQKANIRTFEDRNAATRLLADTAVMLERSHERLKQAIDAAQAARCEQPDFLVEAESVANELVQIVRVDMHAMSASKGINPLASR
jgi:hypothetical protein